MKLNDLTIQQHNNNLKPQKGFTLIELLVVIVIIGVLTTLLMTNFIGIRQRARDAQRKGDLKQIQSALELYRADQGVYPQSGASYGNFPTTCGSGTSLVNSTNTITYIQKIPCDPLNTGQFIYTYLLSANGNAYSLFSCLENVNDSQKDASNNSTYCAGGTTNWSFTLQNP